MSATTIPATLAHFPVEISARYELDIRTGDTVRVQVKIPEKGGKFRLQAFEGIVIAHKHGREAGATITVRKISHGVGVERVFPLYSASVESFTTLKRSRVRRSKLYYIRTKVAREIRRKMRNFIALIAPSSSVREPEIETTETE
jgi:large subunit ribosomal protein L19